MSSKTKQARIMAAAVHNLLMLGLAACANPDNPPAPEGQRNVISAGVGVASVLTDCGDGVQRDIRGAGAGFILTACLKQAPNPKVDIPDGVGILSIGLGVGVTISDCGGFRLTGLGLGLGVVAAPCPRRPRPKETANAQ